MFDAYLQTMKQAITIYEKPTCSTCRQVKKAFDANGIDFNAVNYFIDPVSKSTLEKMVKGLDVPAKDLIRTKEEEFKKLNLDIDAMSPKEIVDVLVAHPA